MNAGGPGCGRQAVCQQIVDVRPNYKHVSVGQLLREAAELKTLEQFNWSDVQQQMDAGELVDDVSPMSDDISTMCIVAVRTFGQEV